MQRVGRRLKTTALKAQDEAVEAANQAVLGYRQRVTVRWKVQGWDPIELVQLPDGNWRRADLVPPRPDIDPQFIELAASPWLRNAVRADAASETVVREMG
jgi:hypothetical protein